MPRAPLYSVSASAAARCSIAAADISAKPDLFAKLGPLPALAILQVCTLAILGGGALFGFLILDCDSGGANLPFDIWYALLDGCESRMAVMSGGLVR